MDLGHILDGVGSVTLSLSTLIAVQLVICGAGMLLAALAFLCVYEPKINGPLQSLIPIAGITSLKKKISHKHKHRNNQLAVRQRRDQQHRENKRLMAAITDSDASYMTAATAHDPDDES